MTEAAVTTAKFLKSTLRLPSSKFPPRPSPIDLARYLPRCTDDLYAWQLQARSDAKIFTLHDGPPYANGDLHVGHALNKTIKDMICRTKLAAGYQIDYKPGWDCHGLPIELKALEKHGWQRGLGVDSVAIRRAARNFASDTVKKQMKQFRSWGIMADWTNHWKTMDRDFELRQLSIFKAMAQNNLIQRRHKPVYWSPSSRTALAEAEIEYQNDFVSTAAFVKFKLKSIDASAVIWTTTPWTIPANQAIAINQSIQYVLVDSKFGQLVVAASRVPFLEEHIGTVGVVRQISTQELLAEEYHGPQLSMADQSSRPIFCADFVTDDSGTGLVHCAPGHGKDDFDALQPLIQAGKVEVLAPVDDSGRYTLDGPLSNLYVYKEGNQKILSLLIGSGHLLASYKFKHKYPIDWRTKEPVMIRATAQWFADVSTIKDGTVKALEAVVFKPSVGKTRLRSFVENRSEWCISRQRAWGVPIPALYHKETGEALITPESIDRIISNVESRGIDAWWSDPADEPSWLPSSEYSRGSDTMDVWFDSGSSWTSMPNGQADVYIEGSDQHRGWFQSSLLTSVAYRTSVNETARAPFKTLLTHGFTLDANEKKMSKSEGNVIAPNDIIAGLAPLKASNKRPMQPHGPDALRLWVASNDWTTDIKVSETAVSNIHTALDKYRVTAKLLLGMLQDFKLGDVKPEITFMLDKIALHQLHITANAVQIAFESFEYYKAVTAINKWIAGDLSGFYFEAIKDIIYCEHESSPRRLSAQMTLFHILIQLQNMLSPITPMLVEEISDHSPSGLKNHLEHPLRRIWTILPEEWQDSADLQISLLMAVNSSVKAGQELARSEKVLGQSLASEVIIHLFDKDKLAALPLLTLKEMLVVSAIRTLTPTEINNEAYHDALGSRDFQSFGATLKPDAEGSWSQYQVIQDSHGRDIGFVIITNPTHQKCARCWKYTAPAPEAEESPLCPRCHALVKHDKPL